MNIFKRKNKFTETPVPGSVSEEYFYRMLSPYALKYSAPYNIEEESALKELLSKNSFKDNTSLAVIGCGDLWYVDLARRYNMGYVAVEPLIDIFVNKYIQSLINSFGNIYLIKSKFGEINSNSLPSGNLLWVFTFNILAYIENPIEHINKYLRQGDILFISSWCQNKEAKYVRKEYFDYLNSFEREVVINPEETIGLCKLDIFPFNELKYYKTHIRIKGKITDVLIIYT